MIITEKANAKIKEIAEAEGIEALSIRVRTLSGGCSGFTFDMEYDNKPGEMDEILEIDGITVIIDPISFQYMESMAVDYKETSLGSGFIFSGGAIKNTCGCGNSSSF